MDTFVAFCENPQCRAAFPATGILGGTGTVQMTNVHVGPCPACGSYGQILDGLYSFSDELIQFLKGPKESISNLKKVETLLRGLKYLEISKNDVIKQVESISPNIAIVLNRAPITPTFQQWIAIIISFITLAIQFHSTYFKQQDKSIEKLFIEHLIQENKNLKSIPTPPEPKIESYKRPTPKVSRNAKCPCGSQKKYKRCCGKSG
jgi:hypothetical protein